MKKKFSVFMVFTFLAGVWMQGAGGLLWAASFDFSGRDFGEILYAVSLYKGFPVIADDTVSGTGTFRCAGDDFDSEFESFLKTNRLYCLKEEGSWTVSRVKIEKSTEKDGWFSLDARDAGAASIFEKLELACGICVISDVLPAVPVTVHTGWCPIEEIVNRLTALCDGYEVTKEKTGFFRIVRTGGGARVDKKAAGKCDFKRNEDGSWTCDAVNASVVQAVEKFCGFNERQFCFVSGENSRIVRCRFSAPTVEEVLYLLCAQCGCQVSVEDGVFIISEAKGSLSKGQSLGKKWECVELRYQKKAAVLSMLNKRFSGIETVDTSDSSFLALCDAKTAGEIRDFVKAVDVAKKTYLVQLHNIQYPDFSSHLPPFVEKDAVSPGSRGDCFYFTGTEEAYKNLISRLGEYDRSPAVIFYDLLIMQYQKTKGKKWNPSVRAGRLKLGDLNDASVQLGSVLDFSLDVVGAFGLTFAADLEAAIEESTAKVFADTTLTGLSGSTIHFENTNTYRYRDNNLDPDTGKPVYSGVTKEIASGLKLDITGVVSGDGMVTSKITASVSRQGTDLSGITGNPPPTSEKVITTEVHSKSGEPVILSGLVQEEETNASSRVPLLSKIPLLGRLFSADEKSKEQTELVIYLLPSTGERKSGTDGSSAICGDGAAVIDGGAMREKQIEKLSAAQKKNMLRLYREFVYEK